MTVDKRSVHLKANEDARAAASCGTAEEEDILYWLQLLVTK
jgi:hypothetical protein